MIDATPGTPAGCSAAALPRPRAAPDRLRADGAARGSAARALGGERDHAPT